MDINTFEFKGKRGRDAFNKVPVFGILERDGIVKVEVIKDVSAESILSMTVPARTGTRQKDYLT